MSNQPITWQQHDAESRTRYRSRTSVNAHIKQNWVEMYSQWLCALVHTERCKNDPESSSSSGANTLSMKNGQTGVRADNSKATVTHITTPYIHGAQKCISEWTTRQSLWWIGYNSSGPRQVPRPSAKIRILRLFLFSFRSQVNTVGRTSSVITEGSYF